MIVTVDGVASNGKMFTVPTGTNVYYYLDDMLGRARVITTSAGAVCYDADFYPFGGERVVTDTGTCDQDYKFTGKERDAETGNDNFGARYYSNRLGRWLSADWSAIPAPVPYANLTNPQTLNLYAMVSDNPESFADLDGHCLIDFDCISAVAATVPTAKNYNTTENVTCNGKTCANKTNTGASGEQADQKRITEEAQQQSAVYATEYKGQGAIAATVSTTTAATDQHGVTTTTVSATTAFYSTEMGSEGKYLGAEHTELSYQTDSSDPVPYGVHLTRTPASASGATALQAQGAAGKPNLGSYFAIAMGRDIRAHPGEYIFKAGEVGALFVPVAQEAEGFKLSLELHVAAVELMKALEGR
ncbi:MAG TPA: RHS repeat-associated core domain-containing protein [Candidatus Acidoferrales bacterium]|nr:RHS repeat-associated core domain-containing protein [Candidatus Acidoferrales bacterium]